MRTPLAGRRILITGAARGIGAALARRLHQHGAHVALTGLEPDLLARVAADCAAPWLPCDVTDENAVDTTVAALTDRLGGLDTVVANAGTARQLPLIGGHRGILEHTIAVNLFGAFYTLRAAGPHISHPHGYALLVCSLAAAVHPPLLGAYSASKAAVEALGDTLRIELRHTGARVGVAYFAELDTDMTSRGFTTQAATLLTGGGPITRTTPLHKGIDAMEHGIARRARTITAPRWVRPLLPARAIAQRAVDWRLRHGAADAIAVARTENAPFTTPR